MKNIRMELRFKNNLILKKTECKIIGCNDPVWPNKTLGFCSLHYKRFKRGRMADNGELLPLPVKKKKCERCGSVFILKIMGRNVRWCKECRPSEYAKLATEHNHGIFRRGHHKDAIKRKYVRMILSKIIKQCETIKKYKPILDMRQSGMTYSDIAKKNNCSSQNVHIICKKYLSAL